MPEQAAEILRMHHAGTTRERLSFTLRAWRFARPVVDGRRAAVTPETGQLVDTTGIALYPKLGRHYWDGES